MTEKVPAGRIEMVAEIGASHSNRGSEEYGKELGLTPEELRDFIKDKIVLDVGSGNARFALEVEIWKEFGLPAPERIDSLNVAYGAKDWETLVAIYEKMQSGTTLPLPQGYQGTISKEAVRAAQARVQERLLALDWRDLSSIPDATYDRIISVAGFPHYSDLLVTARKYQNAVGPSSAKTFRGLVRILKPEGKCRVTVPMIFDEWKQASAFQDALKRFFTSLNCTLEAIDSSGALVIEITKSNA